MPTQSVSFGHSPRSGQCVIDGPPCDPILLAETRAEKLLFREECHALATHHALKLYGSASLR